MSETALESVMNGDLDVDLVVKWLREEIYEDSSTAPQALCGVSRDHFAAKLLHYIHSRTDHEGMEPQQHDGPQPTAKITGPAPGTTIGATATNSGNVFDRASQSERVPAGGGASGARTPRVRGSPSSGAVSAGCSPSPRASCFGDYLVATQRTTHKKRGSNKNTSTESVESPIAKTNGLQQTSGTAIRTAEDTDMKACSMNQSDADNSISSPSEKKRVTPTSVKSPLNVTPVRLMARNATPGRVTTHERSLDMNSNSTPVTNEKKRISLVNVTPVKSTSDTTPSRTFETPRVTMSSRTALETPTSQPVTPDWIKTSARRVTPLRLSSPTVPWSDRWTPVMTPSSECSVMTPLTTTPVRATPSACDADDDSPLGGSRARCQPRALLAAFAAPQPSAPVAQSEPSVPVVQSVTSEPMESVTSPPTVQSVPLELPAAALPRLARLYAAVLDANLTTALPHEIAYLGSLVCQGDDAAARFACLVMNQQRHVLRLVLDSSGLRALAEHATVQRQCPGLCEWAAGELARRAALADGSCHSAAAAAADSGSGARFHADTDGAMSFGCTASFNAARKQRDGLHEVIRWWRGGGCEQGGAALAARLRSLLCAGTPLANQRLAKLAVTLLRADLANHEHADHTQSKLHKLRRRLTAPPASSRRQGEAFYRELISCLDSASWRAHMSDALLAELASLLGAAPQPTTSEELSGAVRAVCALARLLGLIAALPYCGTEPSAGHSEAAAPNDREYWQPPVALLPLVVESAPAGRLCLSLAAALHFLRELEPASRRSRSCRNLLTALQRLHRDLPKQQMPQATRVYLTCVLSCVLSLSPGPQEEGASGGDGDTTEASLDGESVRLAVSSEGIDGSDALDWPALAQCCPQLKGILAPLVVGGSNSIGSGSARHVRPVSLPPDPRQKEKELQSRLESALLAGASPATRRALELCEERAASAAARRLMHKVPKMRQTARQRLKDVVAQHTTTPPLAFLEQELRSCLSHAISLALSACAEGAREHASHAAVSLLGAPSRAAPPAVRALAAVAARRAARRLQRWAETHCTPDTVCAHMAAEVRSVVELAPAPAAEMAVAVLPTRATSPPAVANYDNDQLPSMAETLITLKECICLLLEGRECPEASDLAPALCLLATQYPASAGTKLLLQGSVDLCVAMAAQCPGALSPELLQALSPLWSAVYKRLPDSEPESESERGHESERGGSRCPSPPSSGDESPSAVPPRIVNATPTDAPTDRNDSTESLHETESESLATRLLCPRNIYILHRSQGEKSYGAWQRLVQHLLSLRLVSGDTLCAAGLRLWGRGGAQGGRGGVAPPAPPAALRAVVGLVPPAHATPLLLLSDFAADLRIDDDFTDGR